MFGVCLSGVFAAFTLAPVVSASLSAPACRIFTTTVTTTEWIPPHSATHYGAMSDGGSTKKDFQPWETYEETKSGAPSSTHHYEPSHKAKPNTDSSSTLEDPWTTKGWGHPEYSSKKTGSWGNHDKHTFSDSSSEPTWSEDNHPIPTSSRSKYWDTKSAVASPSGETYLHTRLTPVHSLSPSSPRSPLASSTLIRTSSSSSTSCSFSSSEVSSSSALSSLSSSLYSARSTISSTSSSSSRHAFVTSLSTSSSNSAPSRSSTSKSSSSKASSSKVSSSKASSSKAASSKASISKASSSKASSSNSSPSKSSPSKTSSSKASSSKVLATSSSALTSTSSSASFSTSSLASSTPIFQPCPTGVPYYIQDSSDSFYAVATELQTDESVLIFQAATTDAASQFDFVFDSTGICRLHAVGTSDATISILYVNGGVALDETQEYFVQLSDPAGRPSTIDGYPISCTITVNSLLTCTVDANPTIDILDIPTRLDPMQITSLVGLGGRTPITFTMIPAS